MLNTTYDIIYILTTAVECQRWGPQMDIPTANCFCKWNDNPKTFLYCTPYETDHLCKGLFYRRTRLFEQKFDFGQGKKFVLCLCINLYKPRHKNVFIMQK